jgi:hypothetical protein
MAARVTHTFVSAVPDEGVAGQIEPQAHWNADHTLADVTDSTIVPNTAPAAGQILVGNAGGTAYAPVAVSGDATLASTGAVTVTGASANFSLTGIISPTQIAANTNDYAPTSFATATVLRLNSDAPRAITGLAGGASGRVIEIINVGSFDLLLANESASSTAGNRFAIRRGLILPANRSVTLWYDDTSSRWRPIGEPPRIVIVTLPGDVANADATPDTLANITGLAFPVIAGYTYRFRFSIVYDAAATTTGSRWTASGPALTYLSSLCSDNSLAATTRSFHNGSANGWDKGVLNVSSARTEGNSAFVYAVVTPSADGTVIGRFSSEITVSAITAKAGVSYVEYECIS